MPKRQLQERPQSKIETELYLYFGGVGDWTQGLENTREMLQQGVTPAFYLSLWDPSHQVPVNSLCSFGCPQIYSPPALPSQVGEVTGLHQQVRTDLTSV